MRNVSITGKFIILLGAVGAFVAIEAAFSSSQMLQIDGNYRGVISTENAAATALARANRSMQTARAATGELLMSHTEVLNKTASAEFSAARDGFVKSMEAAKAAIGSDPELDALTAKGLQILDVTCKAAIQAGIASTTDADIRTSQAQYMSQCQPAFPEISRMLIEKTQRLMDHAAQTTRDVEAEARDSVWQTAVMIAIGLVAFLLLGLYGVRHWLVNPVRALSSTMAMLANGNYAAIVNDTDRGDEIGEMARAVQVFKDNGLKTSELERQAEEQRNLSEEQRLANAERDRIRAGAMAEATNGLATGLKQLASGDLTARLERPFAADFESLRADFNSAVDQLRSTLSSVAQASNSIDAGSREVSQSADDLSKRTEQQAASLEETAAALDEITANVANSSKRAEEARTVAIQANDSARQSGAVVANAVDAMGRIEQSSDQISNIIGVIDDIAFQTNLLALNAGVEAARAGEAGKGFAVVAQEVRELAQRSAQAAKEIKDLIGKSSVEVETGVRLVSDTGKALKTIEEYIVTINQHMDAIATSSREQSVGLNEVNTAVNQMDQVTQQNAAMVEEANAAGATLANEAGRLRELIGGFQLGGISSGVQGAGASYRAGSSKGSSASPVSPARGMMGKIAKAFSGRGAAAAATESWEEF